jgi:hypothetical protein
MSGCALLGPQHPAPRLRECLDAIGARPPYLSITAGWQEREGEIDELAEHVGAPVSDLRLYARAERLLAEDAALRAALRERQDLLQAQQEHYRIRLRAQYAALLELEALPGSDPGLRAARRAALGDVRALDCAHERDTVREHGAFARRVSAAAHPALVREQRTLAQAVAEAGTVLIAGGHVAVLLNRMRMFDLGQALAAARCVAWSAGAMALAERVVLYHDHPPQGAAPAELLDRGLGLVAGVLPLPDAGRRLALEDTPHLARFARRFAPATCLLLDVGSWVGWDRRATATHQARRLSRRGAVVAVDA